MKNSKHTAGSFAGKGYYIALILCAAAIGITGYLYYRNAGNEKPAELNHPGASVSADLPDSGNIPVISPEGTPGADRDHPEQPTKVPAKKLLQTASPLQGETIADYAMDCLSYNETTRDWRVHSGIDIQAPEGTPVQASAEGVVYTVYEDDFLGTTVVIQHAEGYITKYSNLAKEVLVSAGESVSLGQEIGMTGSTSLLESAMVPHLHFSVSCHEKPMDPDEFLAMNKE